MTKRKQLLEGLIDQYSSGRSAHTVINEYADSYKPDPKLVCAQLKNDLKRIGVNVTSGSIKINSDNLLITLTEETDQTNIVFDTYKTIYPEFEFLVCKQ